MTYIILAAATFLFAWLYFVPSLEAKKRRHPHGEAIFYLNALLGWTVFGWVLALVWAMVPVSHHAARD